MKRYIWLLLAIFIFVVPIGNLINFLVTNSLVSKDNLNEIIYPSRGWPKEDKSQIAIWNFLYEDTTNQIANVNNKVINNFNDFYLSEFYKYRTTESQNAGKPGYDGIGIPSKDISDYIKNKIILSYDMQVYEALSLRSYFIEVTINKINNPSSNFINPNEYLSLWVMEYFQSGFYYQWIKTWIQDLGRTIEQEINIDFYTFGSLVQQDDNKNQEWGKGPKPDQVVVPLLKLNPVMKQMINQLYIEILSNKK